MSPRVTRELGVAVGWSPVVPCGVGPRFSVRKGIHANTSVQVYGVQAKGKIRMWHHTFPMMKHSFLWFAVRETRINGDETIVYRC